MKNIILSLFLCTIIFSCTKYKSDVNPLKDEISILSVTPNKDLTDGEATEFLITLRYHLITKPQGEINIGFNSDQENVDEISSPYQIVKNGAADTLTFKVTGTPKKWANTPFHVYANLSENPHPGFWVPLASAYYNLVIK